MIDPYLRYIGMISQITVNTSVDASNDSRFYNQTTTRYDDTNVRRSFSTMTNDVGRSDAKHRNDHQRQRNDSKNMDEVPFLLADIGEGIKEVELLTWYVQPGDTVHEFDVVCQVQSDKATVDITSRYAGIITTLSATPGEMIQVGTPLLYLQSKDRKNKAIDDDDDDDDDNGNGNDNNGNTASHSPVDKSATTTNKANTAMTDQIIADAMANDNDERLRIPSHLPMQHQHRHQHDDDDDDDVSNRNNKVLTSPAVRKMAADYGLDLHNNKTVRGTGPQGRILKHDILQYLRQHGIHDEFDLAGKQKQEQQQEQPSSTSSPPGPPLPPSSNIQSSASPSLVSHGNNDHEQHDTVQLKGYSRYMVQTMTQALQIPHMSLGDEVVLDEIIALRKQIKETASSKDEDDNNNNKNNISILSFMLKACSLALHQFPMLNAKIHDLEQCQVQLLRQHHIGVAMDTSRGLVVPAVQNVQSKSLIDIQNELDSLKRVVVRDGQVPPDVLNPTFTLSNIGALGVGQSMHAVLASPQVAMGAVGRIQRLPRFVSEGNNDDDDTTMRVKAVHVAHVSWTGDHRVLDGATLARFHRVFANYLQDPVTMLLHLR